MTSRIEYNNPTCDGSLGLPYHYEMLADRRRVAPFRRAIAKVARGRRVLESGAGSGLLSILAAQGGARAVYAVEKDPCVAEFTRRNLRKADVESVVRLIVKDVRSVTLADLDGERVDMVIAENLSTWNVAEPQISVMNHINEYLAESATVRIPERIFHHAELVRSHYRFADAVDLRAHYFGFTGIPRPVVLSQPTVFRVIDLGQVNHTNLAGEICMSATESGVVNGLRLTSPLQICGLIKFRSSDSLMPPVIVPLPEDLTVTEGDVVRVDFKYQCESDWMHFHCTARLHAHAGSDKIADLLRGSVPAGEMGVGVSLRVSGD